MTHTINQPILSVKVNTTPPPTESKPVFTLIQPTLLDRPESLRGRTYKLKPPGADHALYVTINDILLNEGTPTQKLVPFEIFVNTKDPQHYEYLIALTRVVSAIFRKGGDVMFIVEEFSHIHDKQGGYYASGSRSGKRYSSVIHELGEVIGTHIQGLEAETLGTTLTKSTPRTNVGTYCSACREFAVVKLDGCDTCTSCGKGKCG